MGTDIHIYAEQRNNGYWQYNPYCNASWTQTYAEAAGGQFMELLDTFSQRYGASEDVRFIFWFVS